MDEVFPERNENSISKSKAKKVAKFTSLVASEYEYCERMLRGDWPWEKSTVAGWDSDRLRLLIESLEHTLCMPLLLAARACLAQKDFATIVHLTERFAFRCKLMCRVHTNSLQKVYHEHAARIRASPSSYKTVNLAIDFQKVVTAKASDELFSSSLGDQLVYQPNASNKYLKYFLSTLEHYQAWYSSGGQGQPKCKEKSRVFDLNQLTIEHIYPQSPFPAQSNSSLKPMVNLLGNLTLLGPEDNDKASNKSFEHKKVVFQGSSMQLNKEIAKNRSWNVVNLKKRTKVLCDLAIAVYKLQ